MEERLNKLLARVGVASRRRAEELIEQGRITVNGQTVTEMGYKVDPDNDDIRFDGERVRLGPVAPRYYALYKPPHVITTAHDPFSRPTVMDFIEEEVRLVPVGRLDGASEGLIILTNDGDLANQLTHPRYEHEKEYRIKISGTPTTVALKAWQEGMYLEDGKTLPATVRVESTTGSGTWLRFTLKEGRNRQLRRMIEQFHHTVHKLVRVRMGPIVLGLLKPGQWRPLREEEVEALRKGSNEPVYHSDAPAPPTSRARRPTYKPGWARPKSTAPKKPRQKKPTTGPKRRP